jgi:hypothetical protein
MAHTYARNSEDAGYLLRDVEGLVIVWIASAM